MMGIRVYRFGLRAPSEGRDVVFAQLRAADDYYNTLIEIENGRRAAVRTVIGADTIVAGLDVEFESAADHVEDLIAKLKKERVDRKGRAVAPETKVALDKARQSKAIIGALRAHARRAARVKASKDPLNAHAHASDPTVLVGDLQAQELCRYDKRTAAKKVKKDLAARGVDAEQIINSPIGELNSRANELSRNARKFKTVYSGTAGLIEDAVLAAKKPPPPDLRPVGWTPYDVLKMRRGPAEGSLGPQIQWSGKKDGEPPFTSEMLFNTSDLRVRIEKLPWRAGKYTKAKRENDEREWANLHIRVGSNDTGKPIFAVFPMVLHRRLPDGIIKRVSATFHRIGSREEWTCEVTVDESPKAPTCGTGGAVVVHCGWLSSSESIKVGNTLDEYGRAGSLYLPPPPKRYVEAAKLRGMTPIDGAEYADKLQSIRSRNFDEVRTALTLWLKTTSAILPEWLLHETEWLSRWKTPKKLVRLLRMWAENRFPGDDDAFLAAQWWVRRDWHHWNWWRSQDIKAARYRKNHYHTWAAALAKKYSTLILDDTDYSKASRKAKPDGVALTAGSAERQDGSDAFVTLEDAVHQNRRRAAPGELRAILRNAFLARGGKVEVIKASGISTTCPKCSHQHEAQQLRNEHFFVCLDCGFECDVDTAALFNGLRRSGYEYRVVSIIERMEKVQLAAE